MHRHIGVKAKTTARRAWLDSCVAFVPFHLAKAVHASQIKARPLYAETMVAEWRGVLQKT